jgi:hypothetical protein
MTDGPKAYSDAVGAVAENFRAAKAEALKAKAAAELLQDTVFPGVDEDAVNGDATAIAEAAESIAEDIEEIIDMIENPDDHIDEDDEED